MRFLLIATVLVACKSDPPPPTPAPAPSASAENSLDTTPLPGAPTAQAIAGWWIVEAKFNSPNKEPGHHAGHAWRFSSDEMRLVFGDASDRRPITSSKTEGDALRLEAEGTDLFITRRTAGIALRFEEETALIPLRRATPGEVTRLEAADKKLMKMVERACVKAYDCCTAARGKKLAEENECTALLGKPDMTNCIQAIQKLKAKAAAAKITISECLPDK